MYSILANFEYMLPQLAPDGNYCPNTSGSGDVNNDGNINIQDVISTVNIILNSTSYIEAADINGDSSIDVIDVIGIVNLILG